jgi:hypothetical protein
MPYVNEHAVRINDTSKYERFRRENDKFGDGIDVIWGITKDGTVEIQALRFDSKKWDIEAVRKWLKEHNFHGTVEPAKAEMSGEYVERDARILVAGDYPDKGVNITEADLERLASQQEPVPVIVEHQPAWFFGWVQSLYKKGKELWARLKLRREANTLIEENGVKGVSVGLMRDPLKLAEVSVTARPRIKEAQLFTADHPEPAEEPSQSELQPEPPEPATALAEPPENEPPSESEPSQLYFMQNISPIGGEEGNAMATERKHQEPEPTTVDFATKQELEQLREALRYAEARAESAERALRQAQIREKVEAWVRKGKLAPVSREPLVALMSALADQLPAGMALFSDETPSPLKELVTFVESLPDLPQVNTPVASFKVGDSEKQLALEQLRALGFNFDDIPDDAVQVLLNGGGLR